MYLYNKLTNIEFNTFVIEYFVMKMVQYDPFAIIVYYINAMLT